MGHVVLDSTIYVEGEAMLVTASAAEVLRRFRLPDHDRVVWIDAICINQTDIEERNQQVAIMADFLTDCSRVLIWLSGCSECGTAAYEALRAIIAEAAQATDSWRRLTSVLYDSYGERSESAKLPNDVQLQPLSELFSAAWFGRLWGIYSSHIARGDNEIQTGFAKVPMEMRLRVGP